MKTKVLTKILPVVTLALTVVIPAPAQAQPTVPVTPATPTAPAESAYDQNMRLGYAASQRGEHELAASYFKNALAQRPNDRYATIAYWNAVDALQKTTRGQNTQQKEMPYDRYMKIGYAATQKGDYQTALINFRRALKGEHVTL